MTTDGYLNLWTAIEPVAQRPTLNRCPAMRRVWELMMRHATNKGRI